MILCPHCLHKEMVGAVFCSQCGAQLVFSDGIPTSSISHSSTLEADSPQEVPSSTPRPAPPITSSDAFFSLNIINSGEILPLGGQNEVTLGRVSEGQPVIPDLDLTPYKAYESGVSRMHASIKILDDQIMVTDLGSANGTRINGKRIVSHIPHIINHGDILTLGKFKIQILLHTKTDGG